MFTTTINGASVPPEYRVTPDPLSNCLIFTLSILSVEAMTLRKIVDTLMSEPYCLSPKDLVRIVKVISELDAQGLIEHYYTPDYASLDVELKLRLKKGSESRFEQIIKTSPN